jgi:hypothetical protein
LPLFSVKEVGGILLRMAALYGVMMVSQYQRTAELGTNPPSLREICIRFAIALSIIFCISIMLVTISQ